MERHLLITESEILHGAKIVDHALELGERRFCAPGGTRTPSLLVRSQMLYPLSYERSALTPYRQPPGSQTRIPGPAPGAKAPRGRYVDPPNTTGRCRRVSTESVKTSGRA
jgi:hypothetical protein